MYVFRSERRLVPGKDLLAGLRNALLLNAPAARLDALLRAGELECALADANADPDQLTLVSAVTDALAARQLQPSDGSLDLIEMVDRLHAAERLCIAKPEGFAYYCLHPLDYALLADSFSGSIPRAAVLGLRSIGTTLSAITAAAMRRRGIPADRITVRPHGHPFDRQCEFDEQQLQWIHSRLASSASFFVVDEGPGLSGSSLLSVAEALLAAGVPAARIRLFCSHQPDPERLRARDAARRWKSFCSHAVPFGNRKPEEAGLWLGAGIWRGYILPATDASRNWPASWTQVEHAKYFSRDGAALYKFEGLGRYGEEVVSRSRQLAEAGFAPRLVHPLDHQGYAGYERVDGNGFHAERHSGGDVSEDVLLQLARYCAMRVREFACDLPQAASGEVGLEEMCCVNANEEFEIEIRPSPGFLPCERPVIADARLMPHEWISTAAGSMVKTDGAGHGDDHFFPGPCDIAWDLAGTMIEWNLSPAAADFFVRSYQGLSGDGDATGRLPGYLLAYSLFRMGYCQMAATAMQKTDEEARLQRAFQFYRGIAWEQICRNGFAADARSLSPVKSKTLQPSPLRNAALLPSVQRT